jgi:hypothetical protein
MAGPADGVEASNPAADDRDAFGAKECTLEREIAAVAAQTPACRNDAVAGN